MQKTLQIDSLYSAGDSLLNKLKEQLSTIAKDQKYDEFRTYQGRQMKDTK